MVSHRALKAKIAENCKKNPAFEVTTIAMIAITTNSSIKVKILNLRFIIPGLSCFSDVDMIIYEHGIQTSGGVRDRQRKLRDRNA